MEEVKPSNEHRLVAHFGASLRLVNPDGYLRCVKCRASKPKETGYFKKDVLNEDEGFCKDCIKEHGRERLHLTFPHKVEGKK